MSCSDWSDEYCKEGVIIRCSYDSLEDYCEEFLHLKYVLEELHHYSSYDVDEVKQEFHSIVKGIHECSRNIVESEWFKVD